MFNLIPSVRAFPGLLRRFVPTVVIGCALGLASMAISTPATFALNPERQSSQYNIDYFGQSNGLPSEAIWVTLEGPRGFLWVGTRGGLARFDGANFQVFNSRSHPVFRNNDVRSLTWGLEGELWIGTYGGGALRMENGEFEVFDQDRGMAGNEIYDILVASDGAVWFGTMSGVTRLKDGELTTWTSENGLATNRVLRLAEAPDGAIWFSSITAGLSWFDGQQIHVLDTSAGLDSTEIHLLTSDERLGVVAGTAGGTLYQLSSDGRATAIDRKHHTIVEEMLRDRDGNLWLGTYGSGLWRITPDGKEERFAEEHNSAHVFGLHEDIRGNLWAATPTGLLRLRDSDFLSIGSAEGAADSVFVVAEDQSGAIWTGGEHRGLFRIDRERSVTQPIAELEGKSVSALLPTTSGELWVGTFGDGVYRLFGGAVTHLGKDQGLAGEHVLAMTQARDGSIWVSTTVGVDRVDGGQNRAEAAPGLEHLVVRHLNQGRRGAMWLSTNEGLMRVVNDRIDRWDTSDGLPDKLVAGTHEDERGVLWIITRGGGLARMERDQLFVFEPEVLPVLSAFAIIEDSARNLWISASDGLIRISRDDLDAYARGEAVTPRSVLYDKSDGMLSTHFSGGFQPAAWTASDNRLWFATQRGVVAFDPRDLVETATPLRTFIDNVRVDGQRVSSSDGLRLPSSFDQLEIDYTSPELGNAEAVTFRYRIAPMGFWVDAGKRRTAYFTALPPGETRFQVQARVGSEPFPTDEDAGAIISVYREPRWSETTWAVLAAVIAIIALLAGSQRLINNRARQRERELKQLVDLRTEELREALARVEANSRIDSLTGLSNRRHLEERLKAIWNMALRSGKPVSAIMIDIDCFKEYNDNLGHTAGDECLKRISAALNDGLLRDHDVVARYGGEEFLIVLYDSDADGAQRVARRILQQVRELKLPHPDSHVASMVTISAGFATGQASDLGDPHALVDSADKALYQAKERGRNRIVHLDPGKPDSDT